MELAGERSLGEEQLLVAPAAVGILELLREGHLDRDVARIEGVVAEVDLGGAAFAELAQDRILPDLRQHRSARHLDRRLRARATAFLTSPGALPPPSPRAPTQPSAATPPLTPPPTLRPKPPNPPNRTPARPRP